MLSLRDFTALANQKLVVLLIPVLSPLCQWVPTDCLTCVCRLPNFSPNKILILGDKLGDSWVSVLPNQLAAVWHTSDNLKTIINWQDNNDNNNDKVYWRRRLPAAVCSLKHQLIAISYLYFNFYRCRNSSKIQRKRWLSEAKKKKVRRNR